MSASEVAAKWAVEESVEESDEQSDEESDKEFIPSSEDVESAVTLGG